MNRFRTALLGLVFMAMLAGGACSSKNGDGGEPATAESSPSGSPGATITVPGGTPQPLPASLQEVLDRVAEIRGLAAPPNLKVEFIERSKLTELLDSLTTDEDKQWFAETTRLYRLLGHLANDQDYLSVYRSFGGDAVLGLYSPDHDTLWVVHDDGEQIDLDDLPKPLEETLAHEFVHAVDDYHFDLGNGDAEFEDNLDISLTWTSVIEGNAVTLERSYRDKYLALPVSGTVIHADFAQIGNVPPSIIRELYFPYITGAEWVMNRIDRDGVHVVDDWLKDPPDGTAYILHPELLDSGWQPAQVTLPDLAPVLGKDWKRESGGQFGEFNLRNYLQLQARASASVTAAAGWAGDHYDVYANGDKSVAAFRVRFATEQDAREFVDTHRDMLEGSRAQDTADGQVTYFEHRDGDVVATMEPMGADVIFALASDRDLAQKAIDALRNG